MAYQETILAGSGKEIVQRVLASRHSQLLIPPRYHGMELTIEEPPSDGKYIGLFSSGSTGVPKCIWNKQEHLLLNGKLSAEAFEVEPHHFLLMLASPWHVAGFTWALMAEQLDCEYLFITTVKGDHPLWLKTVQDTTPDYLLTVPAVLRALYDENWFAGSVVYGGYSIKFEEYQKLSPHCSFMFQGYGQTEAGGLISSYKRRSTVLPMELENLCHGKEIEGASIRCEGDISSPAPIYLQSPTAYTSEYYDTGDVGFKDEGGNIYLVSEAIRQSNSNQKALSDS